MNVALLGTGLMGAPMARRLVGAGHAARVWNRTRAKAEGLGAEVADMPAEAAAGAEIAITMLADGPATGEAMRDALPVLPQGAVWVQMATIGLEWTERLAAAAAERGVAYVDAPVLGTRGPAEQGQLVVLAAGPEAARGRCEEVFSALARATIWLDEQPGAGSALKLVANHWVVNSMENIAETVAFAQGLGVDPRRFLEIISGGLLDMPYAHMKTDAILSGNLEPMFTLRLARKDVGLILEAAERAGIDLALVRATDERFGRAIELGHGEEDFAAAYFASAPESK